MDEFCEIHDKKYSDLEGYLGEKCTCSQSKQIDKLIKIAQNLRELIQRELRNV